MARLYPMDGGGLEVKLGLRLMRKSWGLTLVDGVTIGLGTSMFTIWNTATATTFTQMFVEVLVLAAAAGMLGLLPSRKLEHTDGSCARSRR